MLQRDRGGRSGGPLAVRLAKAASRATSTVVTDTVRTGARVVTEARSGRPMTEIALTAASEGWRTSTEVVDIASELAVPGARPVQRVLRTATDALRPPAEPVRGSTVTVAATSGPLPVPSRSDTRSDTRPATRQELRQRGQELLRRSTALDDPGEHPAFRHVLSSLAPDEARIIRHLARSGPSPLIDVVEIDGAHRFGRELCRHVSLLGREAGCIRSALTPVYLDNLCRLGVVTITDYAVGPETAYELLLAQPEIADLPRPKGLFTRRRTQYKGARLSSFGQRLHDVCFADTPVD